jgi:hypothetical protein
MSLTTKSPFNALLDDSTLGFFDTSSEPSWAAAAAPATTGATAPKTALFLTEAGNTSAISVSDINQGQIGDCFLLSSIGEVALTKPADITNMIKVNANGTETVTLYEASNGKLPTFGTTSFKAVQVTVDNTFLSSGVNNGATQDVLNGTKEIWVQVLEKAVATLGGGYGSIAYGGNPMIAMEELTGKAASYLSPASVSAATLQSLSNAGDMLVFDTANSASLPYNLVGNHAYMFEGLSTVNGVAMVKLGNPWGFDQPAAIPVTQLSKAIVEIDVGKAA